MSKHSLSVEHEPHACFLRQRRPCSDAHQQTPCCLGNRSDQQHQKALRTGRQTPPPPCADPPAWLSGSSTGWPRELTSHRLPWRGPSSATGPGGRGTGPGSDASLPLLPERRALVAVVPVRPANWMNWGGGWKWGGGEGRGREKKPQHRVQGTECVVAAAGSRCI